VWVCVLVCVCVGLCVGLCGFVGCGYCGLWVLRAVGINWNGSFIQCNNFGDGLAAGLRMEIIICVLPNSSDCNVE